MLSSGQLTLVTFCVIAAFIILGVLSMRRHVRRIDAPWEADLSEEGRRAQDFERTTRN
ncbi:hypothetical protein GCM10009599_30160 [Luteococcus peritonei]